MKILYKQIKDGSESNLNRFGIHNCYLKELSIKQDCKRITKKPHHHTEFELHLVTSGFQEYEICGKNYKLASGSFLLIFPNVSHTVVSYGPDTKKYSITFQKQIDINQKCILGNYNERIFNNIVFISNEASRKKEISPILIENSILEIIALIFRLSGQKENPSVQSNDINIVVSLAKHYIEDNIESNPCVSDIAKYCYLSIKQLTRLFNKFEGISPGRYITKLRIKKIEELIADSSFSLKQISDIMNFNNEYYFCSFFKKHFGMPPGGMVFAIHSGGRLR